MVGYRYGDRGVVILDGQRLARERSARLATRAEAVRLRRGHPPRLVLTAFADANGRASHVERKVRACSAAGVEAIARILSPGTTTADTVGALRTSLEESTCDAVFVQFPFPESVDGEHVVSMIPDALDVDVMRSGRIRRFMSDGEANPPVTVSAALTLLDGYGVAIAGLHGVLVAEPSPFIRMFHEALVRRGAVLGPVLRPDAPDLEARVGDAALVVAAAARPALLRSGRLSPGAVAIDAGYFNPDGRGDIDTSEGVDHLAAIAPVPGGIGPMTVSMLVERVIEFAERSAGIARRAAGGAEGDR